VRRGSVSRIAAAILYADLRGFTDFAEVTAPEEVTRRLNGIFDCLGEPVRAAGGEILKFLGDGVLAVFLPKDGADMAAVAGATVRTVALTRIVPLPAHADLQERLRERALCFTSARAVEHFVACAKGVQLSGVPVFAGGAVTGAAARARRRRRCTGAEADACRLTKRPVRLLRWALGIGVFPLCALAK